MNSNEKVCPLMSVGRFSAAPCAGESCAWWDHLIRTCCVNSGTDYLRKAGDNLEEALEALADRTAEESRPMIAAGSAAERGAYERGKAIPES